MTSPATQIDDHAQRMLDTVLSQFERSPHINALVEVFGDEIQVLEDWLFAFYDGLLLETAEGTQVDIIGAKVGVGRLGRTDDEYKRIIDVTMAAKQSDGGADQIIDIASRLLQVDVQYVQEGTATFRLSYESSEEIQQQFLDEAIRVIGLAVGGGIQWTLTAVDSQTDEGARFGRDTFGDARFGTIIGGSNG